MSDMQSLFSPYSVNNPSSTSELPAPAVTFTFPTLPYSIGPLRVAAPNKQSLRVSKFTTNDDLIFAPEVSAVKEHIAPHDETVARYTRFAERCSTNPSFLPTVTWKSVQDRFRRILELFDVRNQKERVLSGRVGENSELDQLLGDMSQAEKDFIEEETATINGLKEEGEVKLDCGREIIIKVLQNNKKRKALESDGSEGGPRKLSKSAIGRGASDRMIALSDILKNSDASKFEIEKKRIELEKNRNEQDVLDREAYRVISPEERESRRLEAEVQRDFVRQIQSDSRSQMQNILSLVNKLLCSRNGSSQ